MRPRNLPIWRDTPFCLILVFNSSNLSCAWFFLSNIQQNTNFLMHDLCLEVLTVHGNKVRLFFCQEILTPSLIFMVAQWHISSGYQFNVYSCNTLSGRDSKPSRVHYAVVNERAMTLKGTHLKKTRVRDKSVLWGVQKTCKNHV